MRPIRLLPLVLPLLVSGLSAQVYHNNYVSMSGSDTNTGTKASPWRTITYAAKTSKTGTAIHIGPGTYGTTGFLEGIEITGGKGLVFRGAGQGKTIIMANPGFSKTVPVHGVLQTWSALIVVHGAPSNLAIYDLTIDSSRLTAARRANVIYTNGGEGKTIRTEYRGAGAATTNGAQDHVALLAAGKDNTTRIKVRVSECFVHGFNQTGIRMFGPGLTGVVEFCTVQGAGLVGGAAVAQDGIHVGPGGWDYLVNDCVVRDVWNGSTTKNASGIRIDTTQCPTRILNNAVYSCETGILQSQPTGGFTTIETNNVANCDVALRVMSNRGKADNNHFDAQTSVFAALGVTFPLTGNSYSDFRRSFGYPSQYLTPNNLVVKDTSPKLNSFGFDAPVVVPQGTGARSSSVATGDFDGDGVLDFAVANFGGNFQVYFGSGGSDFKTKSNRYVALAGGPMFIRAGEFNGVAGLDLVVVTADGKAHLFRNKSSGYFVKTSSIQVTTLGTPTSLASGDLDQKDQDDIVIGFGGTGSTNGGVVVMHAKAGVLSLGAVVPGTFRNVASVSIGKLDSDTKSDLVIVDASNSLGTSDKLHVLLQGATAGTFAGAASYGIGAKGHNSDVGDLDGDGDLDVVVTTNGTPGGVHVFENNGSGGFAQPPRSPFQISGDAQAVRIVDLQSDSEFGKARIDVVVCHPNLHKISQLLNYRGGQFTGYRGNYTPLAPESLAFGHANRDGVVDMFVANLGDDNVSVFLAAPDALAQVIGQGCPGYSGWEGNIPVIFPTHAVAPMPRIGNQNFAVSVRNARPLADAVLLLTIREKIATPPCGLLSGRLFYWTAKKTDASGIASFPMPIPNNPLFAGVPFAGQFLVIDPDGNLAGNFAMSPGMRFRLGY
jgi:FG-GAP-like repeat/Protein of unknown function (DUF1565)